MILRRVKRRIEPETFLFHEIVDILLRFYTIKRKRHECNKFDHPFLLFFLILFGAPVPGAATVGYSG
jgi:hypothetical protein